MDNPIVTTTTDPDYLRGQAQKEQIRMENDLYSSRYGAGDQSMDAQINMDIVLSCPKCKARYRKTIKYYTLGQEITFSCEDCDRSVSVRLV